MAGRWRTRPSVWVNVRLVTGAGAVALKTPATRSFWISHDDHRRPIVDVNPGHELIAGPERRAEAELERQQHLGKRALVAIERETGADDDEARRGRLDLAGFGFPFDAQPREKVRAGGRRFGDGLVAARTVITNCRTADEDSGRVRAGRDRAHERARREDAAVLEGGFPCGGPALALRCSRRRGSRPRRRPRGAGATRPHCHQVARRSRCLRPMGDARA